MTDAAGVKVIQFFQAVAGRTERAGGVEGSPGVEARRAMVLGAILLLALALRIVYLVEIADQPLFDTPMGDPWYHDEWTKRIATEGWLGTESFFRAPLYPYLLALIFQVSDHSYLAPRIVQMAMGVLGIFLIYLLSRRLFSDARVALVASLMGALYGILIYFEGELLIPSLLVVLDIGAILVLLGAHRRPRMWKWIGAGILLGLSAIARPNILLFLPFVLAWIWWSAGAGARSGTESGETSAPVRISSRRRTLAALALCLCGVGVIVAPVTIRNYMLGGDLVLIASQGGINLYLGNNPVADGRTARMPPGQVPERLIRAEQIRLGRPMTLSERSRFWYARTLNSITEDPIAFARLFGRKLYFLVNSYEIRNNQDIYFFRRYSTLFRLLVWRLDLPGPFALGFPFGLLLPLALAGMVLAGRPEPEHLIVYLFLASYGLSIVLFFVCARYRVPLIPFLIPFAALAVVRGIDRVRRRDLRPLIVPAVVFLGTSLVADSRLAGVDTDTFAQQHFWNGNAYVRRGEYRAGLEEFAAALEIEPGFPLAHLNRGAIFYRLGNENEALAEVRRELEVNPESAEAHHLLATILRETGRPDQAVGHALSAWELDPWMTEAEVNLALVYFDLGRLDEGEEILISLAQRRPDEAGVHEALGKVLAARGDVRGALAAYARAVELEPERDSYQYRLGLLYGRLGDLPQAERHLARAAALDPLRAKYHADLGTVYLRQDKLAAAQEELVRARELAPDQAEVEHNLGLVALRQGRIAEAREHFLRALDLDSGLDAAREGLRMTSER
ncbi:MAG: hypothetical protein AMJ46_07570 [Latescibacteria bacterium DG_63]|nr:MAG: hypothetical protein AMJ46_07570 [Latescibacteria bacterium DG_63]